MNRENTTKRILLQEVCYLLDFATARYSYWFKKKNYAIRRFGAVLPTIVQRRALQWACNVAGPWHPNHRARPAHPRCRNTVLDAVKAPLRRLSPPHRRCTDHTLKPALTASPPCAAATWVKGRRMPPAKALDKKMGLVSAYTHPFRGSLLFTVIPLQQVHVLLSDIKT